jgi:hypothetical protein
MHVVPTIITVVWIWGGFAAVEPIGRIRSAAERRRQQKPSPPSWFRSENAGRLALIGATSAGFVISMYYGQAGFITAMGVMLGLEALETMLPR